MNVFITKFEQLSQLKLTQRGVREEEGREGEEVTSVVSFSQFVRDNKNKITIPQQPSTKIVSPTTTTTTYRINNKNIKLFTIKLINKWICQCPFLKIVEIPNLNLRDGWLKCEDVQGEGEQPTDYGTRVKYINGLFSVWEISITSFYNHIVREVYKSNELDADEMTIQNLESIFISSIYYLDFFFTNYSLVQKQQDTYSFLDFIISTVAITIKLIVDHKGSDAEVSRIFSVNSKSVKLNEIFFCRTINYELFLGVQDIESALHYINNNNNNNSDTNNNNNNTIAVTSPNNNNSITTSPKLFSSSFDINGNLIISLDDNNNFKYNNNYSKKRKSDDNDNYNNDSIFSKKIKTATTTTTSPPPSSTSSSPPLLQHITSSFSSSSSPISEHLQLLLKNTIGDNCISFSTTNSKKDKSTTAAVVQDEYIYNEDEDNNDNYNEQGDEYSVYEEVYEQIYILDEDDGEYNINSKKKQEKQKQEKKEKKEQVEEDAADEFYLITSSPLPLQEKMEEEEEEEDNNEVYHYYQEFQYIEEEEEEEKEEEKKEKEKKYNTYTKYNTNFYKKEDSISELF